MNKRIFNILCLLSLSLNSNSLYAIEKPYENVNQNINQKTNLLKKIGVALAVAATVDVLLHGITHMVLYPAAIAQGTKYDIPLTNGGGVTINSKELTYEQKKEVKTVWICFPGNAYTGSRIYDYKLQEIGLLEKSYSQTAIIGVTYPGYCENLWAPLNASRLATVAKDAYEYVKENYPNAEIKVYAHSLGGYPATSLLNIDYITKFYLQSPVRLDTVLLKSKALTYTLNWENLSYVDNMFENIPKRKTKCDVFIISGGHKKETGEFLSLYDSLTPDDGKKIKEKLIDTKKLNLTCKINKEGDHIYCGNFYSSELKNYDILTGKADGDK